MYGWMDGWMDGWMVRVAFEELEDMVWMVCAVFSLRE